MSGKSMFIISLCAIVGTVLVVAGLFEDGESRVAAPDDHGASLIAACRKAFEDRDADAFLKLVYTTESPESKDLSSHRQLFLLDYMKPIDSIRIDPLPADEVTSYVRHGVRYRPTLPPAGKMVIAFADDPDSKVRDETTSFLVGQKDGRWWILTAEPDR